MKKIKLVAMFFFLLSLFANNNSHASFSGDNDKNAFKNNIWLELSEKQQKENKINLPSLSPLVKKVESAVLVVTTEEFVKPKTMQIPPELQHGPFRDLFKHFSPFPDNYSEKLKQGQGSGFIIHPSGLAITNHHVVNGATKITVKIGSSLKEYKAHIVGSDEKTDIALIKFESNENNWPVIPLGDSNAVNVGDFAIAIGNPFGLELSVSMGIVSALGRRTLRPSGSNVLCDFIQIDNAINPGNSGGPLLNLSGEVIGINTAISADGHGIAFAIPIDQVKQILPQLKKTGKASRTWLGVSLSNVTSDIAKAMGLPYAHGALVSEVISGSPAEKAGILPGDIITKLNQKEIKNSSSLSVAIGLLKTKEEVVLDVFRNGKTLKLKAILEVKPEKSQKAIKNKNTEIEALGVTVAIITQKEKNRLDLKDEAYGCLITKVNPTSVGQMIGLQINDIIIKLNNQKIVSTKQIHDIINKTEKGDALRILLKRGKSEIFIVTLK